MVSFGLLFYILIKMMHKEIARGDGQYFVHNI